MQYRHYLSIILLLAFCNEGLAQTFDTYNRSSSALSKSFDRIEKTYTGVGDYDCEYQGQKILYEGGTTLQLVNCLLAAPADATELVLTSHGGDVEHGIFAGTLVHGLELSVTVIGWCASSCANYILPAAKNVTINEHSVVYVHGAPNPPVRAETEKLFLDNGYDKDDPTFEFLIDTNVKRGAVRFDLHSNFQRFFDVGEKYYRLGDVYEYQEARYNPELNTLIVVDPKWLKACMPKVNFKVAQPNLKDIAKLFPDYIVVTMSEARATNTSCS